MKGIQNFGIFFSRKLNLISFSNFRVLYKTYSTISTSNFLISANKVCPLDFLFFMPCIRKLNLNKEHPLLMCHKYALHNQFSNEKSFYHKGINANVYDIVTIFTGYLRIKIISLIVKFLRNLAREQRFHLLGRFRY